jgi:hypothetical protein
MRPEPGGSGTEKALAKDLRPGAHVATYFLCVDKSVQPRRDGDGMYFRTTLRDRTGQVSAVHWNPSADLTASFAVGDVVAISGTFNDSPIYGPQINLDGLRKLAPDEFDEASLG